MPESPVRVERADVADNRALSIESHRAASRTCQYAGNPMPTNNDSDNHHMFARRRNSEVSRNFHRLGLLVAMIILTAGLLLMAKDATGLRLWDLIPADIPILAGGIAIGLTGIGLVSLAAYSVVRALGWAIDKSV
jgi:hypothetical protein